MFAASLAKIANSHATNNPEPLEPPKINSNVLRQGHLQNGDITQYYYKRLIQLQLSLSFVTIINLYLIVIAENFSFPELQEEYVNVLLYLAIVCVFVCILLNILRYLTIFTLQKQRKQLHKSTSLLSSKRILSLIIECIILSIQPYPSFTKQSFSTINAFQGKQIYYPINDLLSILSFFKIYVLFRTALLMTSYMSNRSTRLCKMYGCEANLGFSLKCLFRDYPLMLIFVVFSSSALIFAYIIYLAERQLLIQSDPNVQSFYSIAGTYSNALWLILITITTVGYGDYYPQTPLGRLIILFVAIWGTFIVSIMVVVVSNTLDMEKIEIKTSKIIEKLELRSQAKQKASKMIGYAILSKKRQKNQYFKKFMKYKQQFSQTRKKINSLNRYDDIEEQVADHFLNLNSDIDILNENQDKIIKFIHDKFNYKGEQQPETQELQKTNVIFQVRKNKMPDNSRFFKKKGDSSQNSSQSQKIQKSLKKSKF